MDTVWHQSDLMDEVEPVGFATIEEHLARDEAGNLMLADFYGQHVNLAADGQIVLFERHENIGEAYLDIADDWTWTLSKPAPETFSSVTGDNGWVEMENAPTIEDLIARWRVDGDQTPEDLQQMEVVFWRSTYEKRRVCFKTGTLAPVEESSHG